MTSGGLKRLSRKRLLQGLPLILISEGGLKLFMPAMQRGRNGLKHAFDLVPHSLTESSFRSKGLKHHVARGLLLPPRRNHLSAVRGLKSHVARSYAGCRSSCNGLKLLGEISAQEAFCCKRIENPYHLVLAKIAVSGLKHRVDRSQFIDAMEVVFCRLGLKRSIGHESTRIRASQSHFSKWIETQYPQDHRPGS
jgi:hypothetical protein